MAGQTSVFMVILGLVAVKLWPVLLLALEGASTFL